MGAGGTTFRLDRRPAGIALARTMEAGLPVLAGAELERVPPADHESDVIGSEQHPLDIGVED